jgi:hypothetical protein
MALGRAKALRLERKQAKAQKRAMALGRAKALRLERKQAKAQKPGKMLGLRQVLKRVEALISVEARAWVQKLVKALELLQEQVGVLELEH